MLPATAALPYDQKRARLREQLAAMRGAVVAFSAGVDSTALLHACRDALGDQVVAVTADSPSLPRAELDEARALWRPEIGGWLASYAPRHRRTRLTHTTLRGCGAGCGGEGTCDEERGVCQCTSGWRGARCEERERWSCNAADGRYLWSRCAGACDERYGYCLCGSRGAHPERPLLQEQALDRMWTSMISWRRLPRRMIFWMRPPSPWLGLIPCSSTRRTPLPSEKWIWRATTSRRMKPCQMMPMASGG